VNQFVQHNTHNQNKNKKERVGKDVEEIKSERRKPPTRDVKNRKERDERKRREHAIEIRVVERDGEIAFHISILSDTVRIDGIDICRESVEKLA
jgi:hypothetical protein